jgi:hypothetical protein
LYRARRVPKMSRLVAEYRVPYSPNWRVVLSADGETFEALRVSFQPKEKRR